MWLAVCMCTPLSCNLCCNVQVTTPEQAVKSDKLLRVVISDCARICAENGVSDKRQYTHAHFHVWLCAQLPNREQQIQLAHLTLEEFSVEEGTLQPLVEDPTKFTLNRKVCECMLLCACAINLSAHPLSRLSARNSLRRLSPCRHDSRSEAVLVVECTCVFYPRSFPPTLLGGYPGGFRLYT